MFFDGARRDVVAVREALQARPFDTDRDEDFLRPLGKLAEHGLDSADLILGKQDAQRRHLVDRMVRFVELAMAVAAARRLAAMAIDERGLRGLEEITFGMGEDRKSTRLNSSH